MFEGGKTDETAFEGKEFSGLKFDDEDVVEESTMQDITYLWVTDLPAFQVFQTALRFTDGFGAVVPSVITDCLKERKLPIELNLNKIAYMLSGYYKGKRK